MRDLITWRGFLRITGCVLFIGLSGCMQPILRPADPGFLAAQAVREQALSNRANWTLMARIAVSDGHDGGSGTLEWRQQGGAFHFALHAPVTGKTWVLTGGKDYAVLEGVQQEPIVGDNATALLQNELGWHVPITELTAWVLGVRADGRSTLSFRPDGLLAELNQAGWKVEYRDYDTLHDPPLPKKVFATRGKYRVRMVIQRWNFE